MKRLAVVLLLFVSVSVLLSESAEAKHRIFGLKGHIIATGGPITIPPAWDGIYSTTDSLYDCITGDFIETSTGEDTLCAGAIYSSEVPDDSPFLVECKGTTTSTSAHMECDGSGDSGECTLTFSSVFDVDRQGNTYRAVSVVSITSSGPFPCNLFPSTCTRIVTEAVRTGPAPPAYCATPTRSATWGELKLLYR